MKKSKFTNEQIAFALKQAEAGTPIEEVCCKLGVSQQTFYRCKMMFAELGVFVNASKARNIVTESASIELSVWSAWLVREVITPLMKRFPKQFPNEKRFEDGRTSQFPALIL